jgi:GntR family transcriptional repressor for pyruvate dehydrogenase complex
VTPDETTTTSERGVPRAAVSGLRIPADKLKSDRVAAEFERRILSGELEAGRRLPTEADLCEVLGVSRSVIRDAVRSLVARGLVSVKQGQGMTVAEPDDTAFSHALVILLARSDLTMGDVINARAMIETRLMPLAASRGSERDWAQIEQSYNTFAGAVDAGKFELARHAHVEFHVGLLKAIHQPALELFLKPMTEIIMISSAPPRPKVKQDWEVETHPPILEALRAGDAVAAEKAMEDHFAATTDPKHYRAFRARRFSEAFAAQEPWPNI